MYRLLSQTPLRELLIEQAPVLGVSLVVAEVFYKFHSFVLETMAFLATWYAVGYFISLLRMRIKS